MRLGRTLWLALAAVFVTACAVSDPTPDYRYRLTVEVATPAGVRSGSSVIAVEQTLVRPGMNPAGQAVERRIRGEAVAVDLPGGRTLFALLRSEENSDWAGYIMQWLAPDQPGDSFAEGLDDMLPLEGRGPIAVPRTLEIWRGQPPVSAYPMLVTFGDPADPTSVQPVDPDDLAATFGPGVALRRITVEMTDDAVTRGIEGRLGWMNTYRDRWFDGSSTISEDLTTSDIKAHLTAGDFSTEFAR